MEEVPLRASRWHSVWLTCGGRGPRSARRGWASELTVSWEGADSTGPAGRQSNLHKLTGAREGERRGGSGVGRWQRGQRGGGDRATRAPPPHGPRSWSRSGPGGVASTGLGVN